MSIAVALLFPLIGAFALALTTAAVALMIHVKFPRQRTSAVAGTASPPI